MLPQSTLCQLVQILVECQLHSRLKLLKIQKKYITVDPDRTAYKNRDRCKNRDSKENEVDLMMIYESLSFHIEHLSYNWSIITY